MSLPPTPLQPECADIRHFTPGPRETHYAARRDCVKARGAAVLRGVRRFAAVLWVLVPACSKGTKDNNDINDAGDSDSDTDTESDTDLDGNPRIVDGDGDSIETVDMGAYECQP
ncbi:MAG: hypothetical protein M0R80_24600 [Proteobacteria bacterium]|nr:hypothetical protein [Pseudomonadota bacterium]